MFIGVISGLVIGFAGKLIWQTDLSLTAILIGMSIWLDLGLGASIRSYILRFCFFWANILPLNAKFLDDAVITGLLKNEGNAYKFFFDPLLRKYLCKTANDGQETTGQN